MQLTSNTRQGTPGSAWWTRLLWPRWIPTLIGIVMLLLTGKFLTAAFEWISGIAQPIFIPLLISIALAYLVKPIVDWIETRGLKRNWATMSGMIITAIALGILLLIFIPIGTQLSQITTKLPIVAQQFTTWIKPKLDFFHQRHPVIYEKTAERIMEHLQNPSALVEPIIATTGSVLTNSIGILGSALNLVLIPFFVYYILNDTKNFRDKILDIIPPRYQKTAKHLTDQINNVLSNYIRGQLIVCSCMAILYATAFTLLGVRMAVPLGIISGFGHLIPYLGTLSAALLTIVLTLFDTPSTWKIILVITTYPTVQSIEGFLLTPKILGDRLDLHPFLVIIGLLIAHHLFGIPGIILAVPVLATCKVFLEFIDEIYKSSAFYQFGAEQNPIPESE